MNQFKCDKCGGNTTLVSLKTTVVSGISQRHELRECTDCLRRKVVRF